MAASSVSRLYIRTALIAGQRAVVPPSMVQGAWIPRRMAAVDSGRGSVVLEPALGAALSRWHS